jgi:hypothetical protein
MSPTARSLVLLRRDGWLVQVVEHFNHFSKRRADLFGFADVLAVLPGAGVLAVQATSAANHSARIRKALSLPALRTWLRAGCRFEVWSWGKRDGRWAVRKTAIGAADLRPVDLTPRPRRRRKERSLFDGLA